MTQSTSHGVAEVPGGVLLCRGAEADVIRSTWQGLEAIYKVRKPLRYRLPVLDKAIRHQRTLREAEMIHAARGAGVSAPHLYYVDPESSILVLEFIRGPRMKDLLSGPHPSEVASLFSKLGLSAAKLHAAGIMHGDLTTANVIKKDGELVLLDFGLSLHTDRVEDQAVDLRLIKETITGAHPSVAEGALRSLFEGYAAGVGGVRSTAVLKQLKNIERRGRYARVV
ncbi:MAG: Kae1-associated kinase Bud32 [Thaumarchaeota archaeon]|nr:Kae1-associated kinase Bud32 [Nitrososphaerota archaeon]